MLTRRSFLSGVSLTFATPALVRASSLEYVPRVIVHAELDVCTGLYNIIENRHKVVGWIQPWEIAGLGLRSSREIYQAATSGVCELTRAFAQKQFNENRSLSGPSIKLTSLVPKTNHL